MQISFHFIYLPLLAFLLWKVRLFPGLIITAAGFGLATLTVTLPTLPEEGIEGHGIFTPTSISYTQSPFGTSYLTKGHLDFNQFKKVPCQIYTPLHKPRPPGNKFSVEGKLLPKTFPHYVLKPTQIIPNEESFSLAEWRFQIKDWTRRQFTKLFPTPTTAAFLLSMITGELDDRLMSLQFNRLGLLHLLGVSGFQFSLLALLLGALLRIILPGTRGLLLLVFLLSAYAFSLGDSPPIQRAWMSVVLYVIAKIKGYQTTPMTVLGAALFWELCLDPLVYYQLGFQFTFLCTAAIFIVYPLLRNLLVPKRTFSELRSLPTLERVGHVLSYFCREAIALNLAIHLVSLPLIFFHFHKFPLLSLAYNLFLPPAVSIAYFFLIVGLILPPFLTIAAWLTDAIVHIATHPPTLFDYQWRMADFTLTWTMISLFFLYYLFHERSRLLDRIWRR